MRTQKNSYRYTAGIMLHPSGDAVVKGVPANNRSQDTPEVELCRPDYDTVLSCQRKVVRQVKSNTLSSLVVSGCTLQRFQKLTHDTFGNIPIATHRVQAGMVLKAHQTTLLCRTSKYTQCSTKYTRGRRHTTANTSKFEYSTATTE